MSLRADTPLSKMSQASKVLYHWQVRKSEVLPYHPVVMGIELTNQCNFACSFCPQSDPDHHTRVPRTAMEPSRVKLIFEKLRAAGVRTTTFHWTLDGEPFMNDNFHECVEVAAKFGATAHHFASNGFFATPERLHQFPKDGQRYVISTDFCADPQYFETHRGREGSWEVVRNNLVASLNDPGLAHIEYEINDISTYTMSDQTELNERFAALQALFPKSSRVRFRSRVFHNATGYLESGAQQAPGQGQYNLCPYPWTQFIVASNGDVVGCGRDLEHKTVVGNLFRQEFDEVWNGPGFRALRRDLADQKPQCQAACAGCDLPFGRPKLSAKDVVKTAFRRQVLVD